MPSSRNFLTRDPSDADPTLEYVPRRASPADRTVEYLGPIEVVVPASPDETLMLVGLTSADASLEFPTPFDPDAVDSTAEIFEPTRAMRAVRGDPRRRLAAVAVTLTLASLTLGFGAARTLSANEPAVEAPRAIEARGARQDATRTP